MLPPGVVAPGVSAPCVVEPGVVVPGVVELPGVVVELPGVTVPLPAPVAGGTLEVPGPLLLHGAINADVAEVEGLVELPLVVEPAPVVGVVELVAEPALLRAEPAGLVAVVSVPACALVSVPARALVSVPGRVVVAEPVVPTAVESGDVRPAAVAAPCVSSPARVVVVAPTPAPLRATVPVFVPKPIA